MEGHPDCQCEVCEVGVAGGFFLVGVDTAGCVFVIELGLAQAVDRVDDAPGEDDAGDAESDEQSLRDARPQSATVTATNADGLGSSLTAVTTVAAGGAVTPIEHPTRTSVCGRQ